MLEQTKMSQVGGLGLWRVIRRDLRWVGGVPLTRTSLSIAAELRADQQVSGEAPYTAFTPGLSPWSWCWAGCMWGCCDAAGAGRGRVGGCGLTCREGNYSKDKDYTVISPHSSPNEESRLAWQEERPCACARVCFATWICSCAFNLPDEHTLPEVTLLAVPH